MVFIGEPTPGLSWGRTWPRLQVMALDGRAITTEMQGQNRLCYRQSQVGGSHRRVLDKARRFVRVVSVGVVD